MENGSKFTMRFHVKLGSTNEYDNNILVDLPVLVVDDDEVSCEIAYAKPPRIRDETGMGSFR